MRNVTREISGGNGEGKVAEEEKQKEAFLVAMEKEEMKDKHNRSLTAL